MNIVNPEIARPVQNIADKPVAVEKSDDKALRLEKLKKACKDFESIFISYMLKTMHKTTEDSGLFGPGLGGDIYQEIFDEKLADSMASSNQMKIGDMLFKSYSRLVGGSDSPNNPPITDIKTELKSIKPRPDATAAIIRTAKPPENKTVKSPVQSDKKLHGFDHIVLKAAEKFGLKPSLIKAVIEHESAGNPAAVSAKGAKGLMQLMDSTASMLGVANPFDPAQNIMGGAKYLSMLLKKFGGDIVKTIASYNAGPAAVEKYNGIPPYSETQKYVRNVMASMMKE